MNKKENFIQYINDGYSSKGESLVLGAAILDGETIGETQIKIPLKTLNRHGLIAGATGTGKTKTIQWDQVDEYVAGGFKGTAPAAYATCSACHGEDGKGMEAVAPNIRAYDDALVMAVLKNGKVGAIGAMPSFSGRLNETQEKALATYLRSIEGK